MTIDVEAEATWLLGRAGFTASDAPGAYAIAVGVLGEGCLAKVPARALRRSHGELAKVNGRYKIYVSAALPPVRKAYVVLHELAHWRLMQIGYCGPDVETLCDGISAALLVPRDAFLASIEEHGENWEEVGKDFAVSQTIAVLRFGEVTGHPVAVVDPTKARVRGRARPWPVSVEGFFALAKSPAPPMRVQRLTDNLRRTAIVA